MKYEVDIILLIALGFAAWIGWRIVRARRLQDGPAPPAGAPPGAAIIPLGQFAVPPGKRWLLTPPGGY